MRTPNYVVAICIVILCSAVAAPAQFNPGYVALYSDPGWTSNEVYDVPGFVYVYVIHRGASEVTSLRFRVEKSTGVGFTHLADQNQFPLVIGNTQTGYTVSYGSCLSSDIHVATMIYQSFGDTDPCSYLRVIADPVAASGTIEVVDCASNLVIGVPGARLDVNPSPCCPDRIDVPGEFPTIQMAVDAASPCDTIMLAPQTYAGPGNRGVVIDGKPLVVTSTGGMTNTIIDCEYKDRALSIQDTTSLWTEITGITIRNGSTDSLQTGPGGGVLIGDANVRMRNVRIENCQNLQFPGAGVAASGANLEFNYVYLDGNFAIWERGGNLYADNCTLSIDNSEIVNGTTFNEGGGLHLVNSDVSATNTLFQGNSTEDGSRGGAINTIGGSLYLENCMFLSNRSYEGGAISGSAGSIIDCVFVDHVQSSLYGGSEGTALYGGFGQISGCTFRNSSGENPGATISGTVGILEDCLFEGNKGDVSQILGRVGEMRRNTFILDDLWEVAFQLTDTTRATQNVFYHRGVGTLISVVSPGQVNVECSDIYLPNGAVGGSYSDAGGNIFVNPLFCDETTGDYTLRSDSPCASTPCGFMGAFGIGCYVHPPAVNTITDVGNDQGRQARIKWFRSEFDAPADSIVINGYDIYRRQDAYLVNAESNMDPPNHEPDGPARISGWDWVAGVPARGDSLYQAVVPTLCDSTLTSGMCWSAFMVSASTPDPLIHFDSAPDSGYSLDNLEPAIPSGLAIAYNTGSGNELNWDDNPETDIGHYRIYRGMTASFELNESNYVGATASSRWIDPDYDGWNMQYKITAADFAGNESGPATAKGSSTGAGPLTSPKHMTLYQNTPNPFNPSTSIRFYLPAADRVTLTIYDVAGRRVRELFRGRHDEGFINIEWDGTTNDGSSVASGVYFYRLASASGVRLVRSMVLVK